MPRVVWAEESKTGLGIEIGHRQQKLWRKPTLCITPPKKRTKNDTFTRNRVEIIDTNQPGDRTRGDDQRTLERAGYYPNSNRRHTVSDFSLFRCVNRLADIEGQYIGHYH